MALTEYDVQPMQHRRRLWKKMIKKISLRIVPDGEPFNKGEKAWYKLDGCEHWMMWESMIDNNLTTPATAPFIWKHIAEEREK